MTDYENGFGNEMDNSSQNLINQRSENSVLFSLDNLAQAEESDSQQTGSGFSFGGSGDKSGLIDLNTLAQLGAGSEAEVGAIGGQGGVQPVFLNVSRRSPKKYIIIGLVILLILLAGGAAFAYHLYQKDLAKQQAAQAEKEAEIKRLQAEKEEAERLAKEKAESLARAKQRQIDREAEIKAALAEQEKLAAAQQAAAAKNNNDKSSGGSKSSSRHSGHRSSGSSSKAPAAAPKKSGKPNAAAVKKALFASQAKAKKCAKNGNLVVSFKLMPNGKASAVKAVGGSFKGSPTERCILTVIKKSEFPKFSGSPQTVKFRYKL